MISPAAKHRPELLAREKLRYHWPVAVVLVVGLAASFSVFQLASLANVGVGYRDWATLVVGLLAATLLCETVRRTEHLRRSATALSAETSKLKQAAKELETSELRFRLLVEQAPDAILVYDYDLQRFVDANRSAELLFECSKEELLKYGPQHFYTAQQPDAKDVGETVAEHNRRALSGESVFFERRIRRATGKEKICEVRLVRLPSAEARLLRASFIDITDRKGAEENMAFANTLLESEIESAPDGVLVVETEPSRASFNRKFAEMWTLSSGAEKDPDKLLEAVLAQVKDPDSFHADVQSFRLNPGTPITREIQLRNGRVFEYHGGGMQSAPGTYLGRIYFFRDITEKKRAELSLREERNFTTALLGSLPGIFILIDTEGRFLRWNDNLRDLTGLSDQQLSKTDSLSLVIDADRDAVRTAIQDAFACGRAEVEVRTRPMRRGERTIHWTGQTTTSQGRPYLLAVGTDVTESREASSHLRASEERFRAIFNSVNDGIFVSDADNGRFIDTNQRACEMFGYSFDEIIGSDIEKLSSGVPPYTQSAALEWISRAHSIGPQTFEWCCRTKNGRLFWTETSLRFASFGTRNVVLAAVRDITERKNAQQQIAHLARFDTLTGLPNRTVFLEAMEQAIIRARRGVQSFAVLYLDLDHFKDVNDTLGHPVGDFLLQMVAGRLRSSMREIDTAARFGGDEFAVVQTDLQDPADAAVLANKILKALSAPFLIEGNEIRSGTSIGIAVYGAESADAETLLSHADVALYRAKSEGRGTYRFFTDAMDVEVRARVTMGAELREALVSNQFFLIYQPQVDSDSGRVVGLEALVRWNHPRLGIVGPAEFIPVAEHSGLIVALEHWVTREACHQTKQWLDADIDVPLIAINVSVVQFKTPLEMENDIAAILAETGVPPHLLELELTEGVLMEASREHNDALLRLRKMGLRIAIDDFGNGYSSLDYLRRFSVDRIKIAQNFIADLGILSGNRAIVKAALGLARELDIEVVVEGVETEDQLELLKTWGCRRVQGYYFSKPLTAREVSFLMRTGTVHPASDRGASDRTPPTPAAPEVPPGLADAPPVITRVP